MKRQVKPLLLIFTAMVFSITVFAIIIKNGTHPERIRVLIIPKFEIGALSGDEPGEAQYYYEAFCEGGAEYELKDNEKSKIYLKNGVALFMPGMGKTAAVTGLTMFLSDERFDFTDAYLISTGCAGGSTGNCTLGDVVLATAAVDYDLGYSTDVRDLGDPSSPVWYMDEDFEASSFIEFNTELIDKIYEAVQSAELSTTDKSRKLMSDSFPETDWALREPKVIKGTTVTSDQYWKGSYSHKKAEYICEAYGCRDPYASSEMEDAALAYAAKKYGMLDRFISIRVIVDMDTFMNGSTPETLWGSQESNSLTNEDSQEAADIFYPAMKNNFLVGNTIVDMILSDELKN